MPRRFREARISPPSLATCSRVPASGFGGQLGVLSTCHIDVSVAGGTFAALSCETGSRPLPQAGPNGLPGGALPVAQVARCYGLDPHFSPFRTEPLFPDALLSPSVRRIPPRQEARRPAASSSAGWL